MAANLTLYKSGGVVRLDGYFSDNPTRPLIFIPGAFVWTKDDNDNYTLYEGNEGKGWPILGYENIKDKEGNEFASSELFETFLAGLNSQDVNMQDQTTPIVIAKFSNVQNTVTLTAPTALEDKEITVDDDTGIVAGSYITIFNPDVNRYTLLTATGPGVANVVPVDTPIDVVYPVSVSTFVDIGVTNMVVDGSTTPVTYGLRNQSGTPIGLKVDITRILITCLTTDAPQLDEFGNIPALDEGLVLRKRDGDYFNIFNVKSNIEFAGIMYDWTPLSALGSGQNGFYARLTFAGAEKIGVASRLGPDEDLEIIVQDALDAVVGPDSIQLLEIVAEGHIVQD